MDRREHVVAKSVSAARARSTKILKREVWARVAYYYPQYTLEEASKLPARDISLLLKTAEQIENSRFFNLVQIAAAPHTKDGKGVKQLSKHFQEKIK